MFTRRLGVYWLLFLALAALSLPACDAGGSAGTDGDTLTCQVIDDCPVGYECIGEVCVCTSADCGAPDGDEEREICFDSFDCPPGMQCTYDPVKDRSFCETPVVPDGDGQDGDSDYDEIDTRPKCADIVISPNVLNFGSVVLPSCAVRSFEIRNDSNFDIELDIFAIEYAIGQTGEFAIVDGPEEFPVKLARGESIPITVEYCPIDAGIDQGLVTVFAPNACGESIVQVTLTSEYKGSACIGTDTLEHDFGEVNIGVAATQEFKIFNMGNPDGNKVLILSQIVFASGQSSNFAIIDGAIDPLNPVMLTPCPAESKVAACTHTFTVEYTPQSPADIFSPHRARILIVNNTDVCQSPSVDLSDRATELSVEGTASSHLLEINPVPVDFGMTVIHQEGNPNPRCNTNDDCPAGQVCALPQDGSDKTCYKEIRAQIYNYSSENVAIKGPQPFSLIKKDEEGWRDTGCGEFSVVDSDNIVARNCTEDADCPTGMVCDTYGTTDICHIPPGGVQYANFTVRYSPRDVGIDTCTLRIRSTLPDVGEYRYFKMKGRGRLPNVCPTARMSLEPNKEPITRPINDLPIDTTLCFYGSASGDPDGVLTNFSWSVDPAPACFDINDCYFLDSTRKTMCCSFPCAGEYGINLQVQDDEWCWSDINTVEVNVAGNQWGQMILKFSGGSDGFLNTNKVDMDLVGLTPTFSSACHDGVLSGNNGCPWPASEAYGTMPQFSHGAGCCGTTEEMRIFYPKDGPWEFQVRYVNDCKNWVDILVQPFCAGRHSNNQYRLEFYDPNDWNNTVPLWTTTGTLNKAGDQHRYRAVRKDGIWQIPFVKIN